MTKFQQRLYYNYKRSSYHTIWDAYEKPSYEKEKAYEWCVNKAKYMGAIEWGIPTKNTFQFTFAFIYPDSETGELRMGYETATNSYDFPL